MADFLCKSGQKLYYFHKDSGLELDFLVRFKGECVILEVKAKTGKAKSMTTILKNKDVYHVKNAIKLGQYNVERDGDYSPFRCIWDSLSETSLRTLSFLMLM